MWGDRVYNGSNYGGDDNFLGGEVDDHQSTEQWTDNFAQQGEMSTSLAVAKPKHIENNSQSEVNHVFLPRQKSCFILMGLAIVKQSGRHELGGSL